MEPSSYVLDVSGYGRFGLGRLAATIEFRDMPGDALIMSRESKDDLYNTLKTCDAILCIIDPRPESMRDVFYRDFPGVTADSSPHEFYFRELDQLLVALQNEHKSGARLPQVIVFVITKIDADEHLWGAVDNPTGLFIEAVGRETWVRVKNECPTARAFACSALGAVVDEDGGYLGPNLEERPLEAIPGQMKKVRRVKPQPVNVVEPLRWALEELKKRQLWHRS